MRRTAFLFPALFVSAVLIAGCATTPRVLEPASGEKGETFGTTVEGRAMLVHRTGAGSKRVLLLGSIHGNEVDAAGILDEVASSVRSDPALSSSLTLLVVRRANPDGFEKRTRRNARGVDVNRNFPTRNWARGNPADRYYGGAEAFSEPETKALAAVVEREKPAAIFAIHSALKLVNYDGPAEELAKAVAAPLGYRVDSDIGYPTPGSFGTWAGRERGIPIVTLELPKAPTGKESAATANGLLAALRLVAGSLK